MQDPQVGKMYKQNQTTHTQTPIILNKQMHLSVHALFLKASSHKYSSIEMAAAKLNIRLH